MDSHRDSQDMDNNQGMGSSSSSSQGMDNHQVMGSNSNSNSLRDMDNIHKAMANPQAMVSSHQVMDNNLKDTDNNHKGMDNNHNLDMVNLKVMVNNNHLDMVNHQVMANNSLRDMDNNHKDMDNNNHLAMVNLKVTDNNQATDNSLMDNSPTATHLSSQDTHQTQMQEAMDNMDNSHPKVMANSPNLAMVPHKAVKNTATATPVIKCNGPTRFHNHIETREWTKSNAISALRRSTMLIGITIASPADQIYVRTVVAQE
jgi:hypothetical protein